MNERLIREYETRRAAGSLHGETSTARQWLLSRDSERSEHLALTSAQPMLGLHGGQPSQQFTRSTPPPELREPQSELTSEDSNVYLPSFVNDFHMWTGRLSDEQVTRPIGELYREFVSLRARQEASIEDIIRDDGVDITEGYEYE